MLQIIADNMYAQVDDKGHHFQLLAEIQYHRKYGINEEGKFRSTNGMDMDKITIIGCEVMLPWKNGSTDWIHLNCIKDSNPFKVTEYAVVNCIHDKPAFLSRFPRY